MKPAHRLRKGLLLFLLIALAACGDDFLVKAPLDQISDQNFWRTADDATQFVNAIYHELPDDYMAFWSGTSDDAYSPGSLWEVGAGALLLIGNGSYDVSHDFPAYIWRTRYEGIRKTNVFLASIDGVEDIDPALKKRLIGEVRFLRAYFYHDLVRFFGGVPLSKKPLELGEAKLPRSPKDEVVTFMLQDLDAAVQALPSAYDAADEGRATRGAALALKSRVLLYNERWDEAAAAAQAVIDLGVYELFPDYGGLFRPENENNVEVLFAHQYVINEHTGAYDTRTRPLSAGGWCGINPTRSLVEAYEMIDGTSIEASPLYDPEHPFENRDPRFEATIMHTGSVFLGEKLETWPGALPDGIGNDVTRTGYYVRKHLDPEYDAAKRFNTRTDWILIRYAEVLLNYAEAKNEAVGPVPSVYDAVNRIRTRVEMPPLEPGLTKAQMRQAIRHERRIELVFEGHRFFDIRRWEIADEVLNGPVYGMKWEGEYIFVEDRVFQERHYLFPIPLHEMDTNPKLKQNPGW